MIGLKPLLAALVLFASGVADGQDLESTLAAQDSSALAELARRSGDARRGAVVFHQPQLACARCHVVDGTASRLGPDLTVLAGGTSDEHLVESILAPSRVIREGYTSVILEAGGEVFTGLLVAEDEDSVVIRDTGRDLKERVFARADLDALERSPVSAMPSGLTNLLTGEQQFLDLVRYLMELRDGGSARARELAPDPALHAALPLPEYEERIDHAGFLRELDDAAFERGRELYDRACLSCHGTHDEPGSLPTSRRFASEALEGGSDPLSLYRTLTRGYGMMVAQTWMVPSQKYDVIHYLREAYLREHNPSQYAEVDEAYLTSLPAGTERGPQPRETSEWSRMDYGPNQTMTLEVGDDGTNFAYKGHAIRLDAGPGGVAQGRYWMLFDADTLRVAAAWSGEDFIDWRSIHFDGRHNIHPRVVGDLELENPTGPGWGRPGDGSFEDTRLVGRDGRRYGPLDRSWARFRGQYAHGADTLLEYTVGGTRVLELPGVLAGREAVAFTRTFDIGPRSEELVLQVAHLDAPGAALEAQGAVAWFGDLGASSAEPESGVASFEGVRFDGSTYLELEDLAGLDIADGELTLTARLRTDEDGTLVALTGRQATWLPDGWTWFVRDGRLAVDIGWVGAHEGSLQVADGEWHEVAVRYRAATGELRFFVDGEADPRRGELERNDPLEDPVLRIGYTAEDFPDPSAFRGELAEVRLFDAALRTRELGRWTSGGRGDEEHLVAEWNTASARDGAVEDLSGHGHHARVCRADAAASSSGVPAVTVAGVEGEVRGLSWSAEGGDLRLHLPAGEGPLRFTLWFAARDDRAAADALAEAVVIDHPARDLEGHTRGGPSRWAQELEGRVLLGADDGPFAVDVLERPTGNPWACRMRLTGLDFVDGGDAAIVSSWDGSLWRVSGLNGLPATAEDGSRSVAVRWRRIASGLFQPLGVKVLDGQVYVTCRDQLMRVHDLDGDGEIDRYECFNGDHQVTDHFHEFAMGLQADAEGNLLYAKSARHALPAVVPHHGTLLRVSADGERTEIVAKGFRAANGVCVNPDGTFIVTDQEGHWNPKNRINHVRPGGFYGNMYGYHEVTDEADEAMERPLAWITNAFDRSPGELLWVDSPRWGPLQGRLLNLSYGHGQVYVVPHEELDGQLQGGMCALPLPQFPTGVMRGRFHPQDGQLYLAGMFAWAGNQQQPGGLYRLRATGAPMHLPVELSATRTGLELHFTDPLDRATATDPESYRLKAWDLRRSANYGSPHLNERAWTVTAASLSEDGRTLRLTVPGIEPTRGMELRYELLTGEGAPLRGKLHGTIHRLR